MSFKYILYFSTELNGFGYKIGNDNFDKFISIMFDGLNVIERKIDNTGKIFTVVSESRLSQDILNQKRQMCTFRFSSGKKVQPYIMVEMS